MTWWDVWWIGVDIYSFRWVPWWAWTVLIVAAWFLLAIPVAVVAGRWLRWNRRRYYPPVSPDGGRRE